ncbi:MAG TPA: NTP transferase domain-containing protein, partial [Caulobacteraceae bacterium]|nr:NTP transferase domain-containing protein [Caulobacteraceae bacterium]
MSQAHPALAGLVIAGGRSNRFGAEKAVQLLKGRSLLEWAASALAEVCADVAVSARADSGAA